MFKIEEIVKGSLILFIMINIFYFLNYVFHFSMARLLGPADYGVLAVLMSIVYIFSVVAESIQTVVSRFTTKFNIKKQYGKIKYLLVKTMKRLIFISIILFLIYVMFSFFLSYFTKIELSLIIFTGFLIFAILIVPILRGVMQGRKKFKSLGLSMIIESILKLFLALVFVYLGLRVYGAIGGVILGVFFSLFISFAFIKKIVKAKIEKTKIKEIYSYSFPVLIVMFTVILMASMDIIFAKIFFSSEIAGKYAVASMLGKMIFFGTSGIGKAMFPLTSEGYDANNADKRIKKIFRKSFLIVFGLCFLAVMAYWLFPRLVIGILFGNQYLEISSVLVFIGLGFSFLSLGNVSLIYSLSIYKKKISWFILFVFLEIIVLSIFHSNLIEFSVAFMTINFIMFISSLIFTKR